MKNVDNLVTPVVRDQNGLIASVSSLIDNATDRAKIINADQSSNASSGDNGSGIGDTVVHNRNTLSTDIDHHK